jgi:glycosyltransferase involved in cell wall biosynthesis
MSTFDVVVPCYNYGHFLRACVDSVLTQGVDVRVLILDDCSSDSTPETAGQLVAEDARVEYRRHDQNKGHIATYNEGLLNWACRDYCLLLSADDMLAPGALRRAANALEAHPDVGWACGRVINFESCPPTLEVNQGDSRFRVISGGDFLTATCRQGLNLVYTPSVVVRTRIQHQVGGYRAELPHTADFEMWMRYAAKSHVAVINAYQAFYRVHPTNMHHAYSKSMLSELRHTWAALESVFRSEGPELPQSAQLRSLAMQAIASRALFAAAQANDGDLAIRKDLEQLAHDVCPPRGLRRVEAFLWCRWRLSQGISKLARRVIVPRSRVRIGEWPSLPHLLWPGGVQAQ